MTLFGGASSSQGCVVALRGISILLWNRIEVGFLAGRHLTLVGEKLESISSSIFNRNWVMGDGSISGFWRFSLIHYSLG